MKSSGFIRHLVLGTLLIAVVSAFTAPTVYAQSDEQVTLEQMKMKLRDEGKGRNLSQLTHAELEMIKPTDGGAWGNLFNTDVVLKIGTSTFILDLVVITVSILFAFVIIVIFFTPIMMYGFRGGLHAGIGGILSPIPLFHEFGEILKQPKKRVQSDEKAKGNPRLAFAQYMHLDFIPKYKNNITAIAFMGTAFLILNIGLRGVKFMTAHEPLFIIVAIIVEITVLLLLGLTTWYEQEEDEVNEIAGEKIPGKQLSLADVEARLEALKDELKATVQKDAGLRH